MRTFMERWETQKLHQVFTGKWIEHLKINRIYILMNIWQNKYITKKSDYEAIKANINVKFEVILVKHRKTPLSAQK